MKVVNFMGQHFHSVFNLLPPYLKEIWSSLIKVWMLALFHLTSLPHNHYHRLYSTTPPHPELMEFDTNHHPTQLKEMWSSLNAVYTSLLSTPPPPPTTPSWWKFTLPQSTTSHPLPQLFEVWMLSFIIVNWAVPQCESSDLPNNFHGFFVHFHSTTFGGFL